MSDFSLDYKSFDGGTMAIAGLRLRRILSAELFLEMAGMPGDRAAAVAGPCQDRWTDLADCLAALVDPVEAYLVIGSRGAEQPPRNAVVAFLAVGRGPSEAEAAASCRRAFADLRTLLATVLGNVGTTIAAGVHVFASEARQARTRREA